MAKKSKASRYSLVILAVVIFIAIAGVSIHETSKQQFCVTCHEMKVYADELALSPHAKDTAGSAIECSQCHLPPGTNLNYLPMKGFLGVKDLLVHLVNGPEPLDRTKMQKSARRYIDDSSCRVCHVDLGTNAKGDGAISTVGRLAHDNYLGKNGQARSNCVGCHINLAHLPKFDQRLESNTEFTSKILEQEVQQ